MRRDMVTSGIVSVRTQRLAIDARFCNSLSSSLALSPLLLMFVSRSGRKAGRSAVFFAGIVDSQGDKERKGSAMHERTIGRLGMV